jgi:hypothetical protein
MSAPGYVAQLLNSLDADTRTVLTTIFDYVMRENALGDTTKAENFNWFRIEGTTSTSANTEFSVEHGLDHVPSKLIPIVPLDTANAQLVPLTVSRAADARRIYLKSASVGVTFQAYLE